MRGKISTPSTFGQNSGTKASMRERKKKQEDELLEQTTLPTGEEVSKQMWQLVDKSRLEKFFSDLLHKSQATEQNQAPPPSAGDGQKNDRLTFGPQSPRSSDDIVTPIFEKASSMKLPPSFEPDNHSEHKDIPLLRAFSEQPHEHKHSTGGFSFTKVAPPSPPLETDSFARSSLLQSSDRKASPAGFEAASKSLRKQGEPPSHQ